MTRVRTQTTRERSCHLSPSALSRYLEVELTGSPDAWVLSHVPRVTAFLDEALCSGGRALVHGNLGVSLSAALIVAYVMRRLSLSLV